MSRAEVYIVGAARTPIGVLNGSLASMTAAQLGAVAVREALHRGRVAPSEVQECFIGNVVSANIGQAPARQVALGAGLPESVVCTTVNKVCASGLKAVILAAQSIALGACDVAVAGGAESASNVPFYLPGARQGLRLGHGAVVDGVIKDGLWDPYGDKHMGNCAETCAREHNISRAAQDDHAATSFARARAAVDAGFFAAEIAPVAVVSKKGTVRVAQDESVSKGGDPATLAKLVPAFQRQGGTVTAGNASGINDGAAAVVLASAAAVKRLGLVPLALIRGWGEAAHTPERFTTAPALAIPKALSAAGVSSGQVDAWEINEAFSVVIRANEHLLGLDPAKVNICGGAVALGHPVGASGCRILVTLLNVLTSRGGALGCAAICNGGGGASALVVQRLFPQPKL